MAYLGLGIGESGRKMESIIMKVKVKETCKNKKVHDLSGIGRGLRF